MITYTQMNISKKDVDLFFRIQKLINDIDEFPGEAKVSCHTLSYAIGEMFDLDVETGYWRPGYEHSWCRIPESAHIIDVYPWGTIGGPFLIVQDVLWGTPKMYTINNSVKEERCSSDNFFRSVDIIKKTLGGR